MNMESIDSWIKYAKEASKKCIKQEQERIEVLEWLMEPLKELLKAAEFPPAAKATWIYFSPENKTLSVSIAVDQESKEQLRPARQACSRAIHGIMKRQFNEHSGTFSWFGDNGNLQVSLRNANELSPGCRIVRKEVTVSKYVAECDNGEIDNADELTDARAI